MEECGRWKLSIACSQPIGFLQVLGLEGNLVFSTNRGAPPPFGFILFCITIYCTGCYLFLLCSILLSSFSLTLSLPFTPPFTPMYPALHAVYLPCSSAALRPPTPNILQFIVSFLIKYFPSSLTLSSSEYFPMCCCQSG